ncbi:MAG TPA: TMEM175 family protein [Dehalococcoidia bacterium]|nr:TMEM175 family protein [Dehalococcoidia bacterium]
MTSIRHEREEHANTLRLEAFSDGVFAIAITLLVLEIGVPHVDASQSLDEALRHLWPSYFGYAVSFLTIGVMWINHHALFKDIDRQDHTLLVLNLLLLLGVAFLPFPTAVVAEYMRESEHRLTAALTWGCTLVVIASAFDALWLYASVGRRLIDDHVSDARLRSRTRRYVPGPLMYLAAIALAFVSPWISLGLYGAYAVFWLLPVPE